ncbi:MAG: DUF4442 domain-containing protein [Cyclobacteriaceae bacterium]|nr:DUF4442 domain-containing protein [Cyclobacteriaceae bacterium]
MNTKLIIEKAKTSKFYLGVLNMGLSRMIPFNKPHGFKIIEVRDYGVKTIIPYKKSNYNHIKGLHACGLATISEFTTGFVLVNQLDSKKYRIIMQKLEMEYFYQGKMDAFGEFEITKEWMNENIYVPLETKEAIVVLCEVKIHDKNGNHLTTGKVHWQVKPWNKVRTKIN